MVDLVVDDVDLARVKVPLQGIVAGDCGEKTDTYCISIHLRFYFVTYWAVWQVIGRDFLENIPGVASFALAVCSSADWLGHEASSKS